MRNYRAKAFDRDLVANTQVPAWVWSAPGDLTRRQRECLAVLYRSWYKYSRKCVEGHPVLVARMDKLFPNVPLRQVQRHIAGLRETGTILTFRLKKYSRKARRVVHSVNLFVLPERRHGYRPSGMSIAELRTYLNSNLELKFQI